MNNINTVTLTGNLTRDVELKYSNAGNPFINFGIAVNESYKENDEWKERPNFFNCVMFGKITEYIANNVKMGTRVTLTGKLRNERYDNKMGEKISIVKIIASQLEFPFKEKDNSSYIEASYREENN